MTHSLTSEEGENGEDYTSQGLLDLEGKGPPIYPSGISRFTQRFAYVTFLPSVGKSFRGELLPSVGSPPPVGE